MGYFPDGSVTWTDGGAPRIPGGLGTTPVGSFGTNSSSLSFGKPADWLLPRGGAPKSIGSIMALSAVPVAGPFMALTKLLEGGSSTSSRMGKFNASLEQARQQAAAAVKNYIPKAQTILTQFANAAKQIQPLVDQSANSSNPDVATVLDAVNTAFADADAAVSPITDTVNQITDAAEVYKANADTVNPWNTAGPGLTALDTVSKGAQQLATMMAQAARPLTTLTRALATAKAVVKKDADTQAAADAAAKRQAIMDAQGVVSQAIQQANQIATGSPGASYGQPGGPDFDGALAVLNDPAIGAAASAGNMVVQLQSSANAIAKARDNAVASTGVPAQNSQMQSFFDMLTQMQQQKQAQNTGIYTAPNYYNQPSSQPTDQPSFDTSGAPTQTSAMQQYYAAQYAAQGPSPTAGPNEFGGGGGGGGGDGMGMGMGMGGMGDITDVVASARLALTSRVAAVKNKLAPVLGPDAVNGPPDSGYGTPLLLGAIALGAAIFLRRRARKVS